MNKKTVSASFFLTLLFFTIVGSGFTQATASVGIHQGNFFKYDLSGIWSSTNPNETAPAEMFIQNFTEYYKITVQLVSGTQVQLFAVTHYNEDFETNETQVVDVNTGDGNSTFVYSAGLSQGSYLFPGITNLPWQVNETIPRYYLSNGEYTSRQTNHISVNRTDIEGKAYSLMDLYFDKATGMVVESYYTYVNTATPQQTITQHLKLIETNAWALTPTPSPSPTPFTSFEPSASASPTPENTTPAPTQTGNPQGSFDPLLIVLILAVAIVLIIAVIVVRRAGKKSSKQPPTKKPITPAPKIPKTAEKPPALAPTTAPTSTVPKTKNICSKCGKENPADSEFCNKCGNKLQD